VAPLEPADAHEHLIHKPSLPKGRRRHGTAYPSSGPKACAHRSWWRRTTIPHSFYVGGHEILALPPPGRTLARQCPCRRL